MASNLFYDIYDDTTVRDIAKMSDSINRRIDNLNADEVSGGEHNKFIVNNVYGSDLTVMGKLTVQMLEVTDLGVVIEADDGTEMNTDIQSYIKYVTCNIYETKVKNDIASITADAVRDGQHNKYIVDNVYDNDLIVSGKLTVDTLEIRQLGITYGGEDDSNVVNSDIKGYVSYVASNIYNNLYDGVNNGSIANISNIVRSLTTDDIKNTGQHNRFIVNNVYDDDLTVVGKLTVQMLEVTDLGVVIETDDGVIIS